MGADPAVGGDAKEARAVDHLLPGFGERRRAELHAARLGDTVPGSGGALMILVPGAEPGEVGGTPNVAEQEAMGGGEGEEESMVASRIHEVGGVATCRDGGVAFEIDVLAGVVVEVLFADGGRGELGLAGSEEGRAEGDVLGPGEGTVFAGEVSQRLVKMELVAFEAKGAGEVEPCAGDLDAGGKGVVVAGDLPGKDAGFAMDIGTGGGFGIGGGAEEVEAEIVAMDAGEKAAFAALAVAGVVSGIVGGRLDGGPGGRPEGIDAGGAVGKRGEVAAFHQNDGTELLILDLVRAAPAVANFGHRCLSTIAR